METKTQHTPKPWRIRDSHFVSGQHYATLIDSTNAVILTGPIEALELIVRACNNHEALVTALGASTRLLSMVADLLADGPHCNKGQFISAQCSLNNAALKAIDQ